MASRRKMTRSRNPGTPIALARGPWMANLLAAFPGGWAGRDPFYDGVGNLWTPSWTGSTGPFYAPADEPHVRATVVLGMSQGSKYTTSSFPIPTGDMTAIWVAMTASSGLSNSGGIFGAETTSGTNLTARLLVLWSFSTGTLSYFDYGNASGANRISYTVPANFFSRYHVGAIRAGSLGSQIWEDRVLKASQGTAITRVAGTGNFFLGTDGLVPGPSFLDINYAVFLLWNSWLPDALFHSLMTNPYQVFQGRTLPLLAQSVAAAGTYKLAGSGGLVRGLAGSAGGLAG